MKSGGKNRVCKSLAWRWLWVWK